MFDPGRLHGNNGNYQWKDLPMPFDKLLPKPGPAIVQDKPVFYLLQQYHPVHQIQYPGIFCRWGRY